MKRMYADFTEEAYYELKNGNAISNNGFRKKNGTFHPNQPSFSEISDDFELVKSSNKDKSKVGDIATLAIFVGAIGLLAAGSKKKNKHSYDEFDVDKYLEQEEKKDIDRAIRVEEYRRLSLKKSERKRRRQEIKEYCIQKIFEGLIIIIKAMAKFIYIIICGLLFLLGYISLEICKLVRWVLHIGFMKIKKKLPTYVAYTKKRIKGINNEKNAAPDVIVSIAQYSAELTGGIEDFGKNMNDTEAKERLLRIFLLSKALSVEINEMKKYNVGENEIKYMFSEWEKEINRLSDDRVLGYINYIFANAYRDIDATLVDSIGKIYSGGYYCDMKYVPVRKDKVYEALNIK